MDPRVDFPAVARTIRETHLYAREKRLSHRSTTESTKIRRCYRRNTHWALLLSYFSLLSDVSGNRTPSRTAQSSCDPFIVLCCLVLPAGRVASRRYRVGYVKFIVDKEMTLTNWNAEVAVRLKAEVRRTSYNRAEISGP